MYLCGGGLGSVAQGNGRSEQVIKEGRAGYLGVVLECSGSRCTGCSSAVINGGERECAVLRSGL